MRNIDIVVLLNAVFIFFSIFNQIKTMYLENYVKNWKLIEGQKPINETAFIDGFIDFMNNLDDVRDLEHEGNNYQGGQQLVICKDATYCPNLNLHFEINYCPSFIKVYRADHDGYWTPEYLKMKNDHPRYSEVAAAFYGKLFELWQLPTGFPACF